MYTETKAIVFRQIKTVSGRRMIVLFSEKYGKISAGSSINERSKGKNALSLRPFCCGKYELYKGRDSYSINGAEVIRSFYSLGEDVDKYMAASYVLELTDSVLAEDEPQPGIYRLLDDFLDLTEQRETACRTLVTGYQIRLLSLLGIGLSLKRCVRCGAEIEGSALFSVAEGGLVCPDCALPADDVNPLIFRLNADIIQMLGYMQEHPIRSLRDLAVPEDKQALLDRILSRYISYHLGVGKLKSEGLRI